MRFVLIIIVGLAVSCSQVKNEKVIQPKYITDPVKHDSDDPAIWINSENPQESMIIGTDKHEIDGGLYAFSLDGKMDSTKKVYPLDRPNNVDIAYGFLYADDTVDVAVCSERGKSAIRVFQLPELKPIDNGGLSVFEDDTLYNKVMGVSLYTRPSDLALFAIVSRKEGENLDGSYLYQYLLSADSTGVKADLVRKFGKFSGTKEIEAICVDDELGYVYYSDEHFGVRKYYADPDMGNEELATFGLTGFADDREGISIYDTGEGTGYILVSDQGANKFHVFPREGSPENPHQHELLIALDMNTRSSDGSESTSAALGEEFPSGVFVAMSDNKTFEIYDWRDLLEKIPH